MRLETARDYRYTGAWLRYFQREYERLKVAPLGSDHSLQREGELDEILSQIEDFKEQMEDFKTRQTRETVLR
jgi:hypothetical protein